MKFSIFVLFFLTLFTPSTLGKVSMKTCENLDALDTKSFVLFNKKELVELGECVALEIIKSNKSYDWGKTCREYIEDEQAIIGTFVLSKLEAIQIGQCIGAINYTYMRYHKEERHSASCLKGKEAIQVLATLTDDSINKRELKSLLCW